jgi:transcription antitermination factor NusB
MRKRTIARECVLKILYQIEVKKDDPQEVIRQYWEDNPVDEEVSSFADRIVSGTLAHLAEIDTIVSRHTDNWDLARMAILDRNILRFGAYEILFEEDIPPKVTINEAVNIAKKFSQEDSGKFVNGVLDHINHNEKPLHPKR